jgi:hypothetical protein
MTRVVMANRQAEPYENLPVLPLLELLCQFFLEGIDYFRLRSALLGVKFSLALGARQ